jgi:geranylgeranyl diphosphate synthase type II
MLEQILEQGRAATDAALERLLPPAGQHPTSIHQAMRHSVFAGGKRLRPTLCLEAARLIAAGSPETAGGAGTSAASSRTASSPSGVGLAGLPCGVEELGAALEMIHTYSLIHDDLPALDNDDLRRGRPTCHVVYGESTAILAGDALQTLAYDVLARLACSPEQRVRIIYEVAHGTGTVEGMIGGQVVDLESEGVAPDADMLEYIHRSKTGALITASLVAGSIYAGGHKEDVERVRRFGRAIGLAFQIADDVLDVTQSSEQLGKTAGKDQDSAKATYPALFGIEESMRKARELVDSGCAALDAFGARADTLKALARFLVERKS